MATAQTRIAVAQQRRARDVQQKQSMTGQVAHLEGRIRLDQPGEALVDVTFPVTFIEIPIISGDGWDLEPGSALEAGNFPRVRSCGAVFFAYYESSTGARFYTGARLAIEATGHTGMQLNVHVTITGKALTNPTKRDPELL
jgi:hypothetical protein